VGWIKRPSVDANVGAIFAPVAAVLSVMAFDAQALQRSQPERIPIARMRHDVIGDRCRRNALLFEA
jgi:hypothetical protein